MAKYAPLPLTWPLGNPLHPSAAHRWMHCPASAIESYGFPEDEGSVFAEEGTRAHAAAEKALRSGEHPEDTRLRMYTDFVQSLPGVLHIEHKLDLRFLLGEEGGGTADCWSESRGVLYVNDLKWGMGVIVHAAENPQLMSYAGAVYNEMKGEIKQIRQTIIQPRRAHIDSWTYGVDVLCRFIERARAAATEINDAVCERVLLKEYRPLEYFPGAKACIFCPLKIACSHAYCAPRKEKLLTPKERAEALFGKEE